MHINAKDSTSRRSHWLLVTTRENWSYLRSKSEWAFRENTRSSSLRVAQGDHGIVYLLGDGKLGSSAIGGLVEFVGAIRTIHGINSFDQSYPIRIDVRVIHQLNPPTSFAGFVSRLEFIKSKSYWGAHLRGRSLIRLSDKDYETLRSELFS